MPIYRHIIFTLILLSISTHAIGSTSQEEKLHLGNGIAAIAEGEIVTFEQLRKSLDPIIPKLPPPGKKTKPNFHN